MLRQRRRAQRTTGAGQRMIGWQHGDELLAEQSLAVDVVVELVGDLEGYRQVELVAVDECVQLPRGRLHELDLDPGVAAMETAQELGQVERAERHPAAQSHPSADEPLQL